MPDGGLLQALERRFPRREPRAAMLQYVRGLSAPVSRKNAWTLAGLAGSTSPDSMQRLLRTAEWDIAGARDDVRAEVVSRLGTEESLWILDETAFRKRGASSAGVDKQYMRNDRRLANCQIGIFLIYATARGQAMADRELYLPPTWSEPGDRRRKARIPDDVAPATKAMLGCRMLARAHDAGLLEGWVTADKTYGSAPALRRWLLERTIPHVLATNNDDVVELSDGHVVPVDAVVTGVLTGETPTVDGWRTAPIVAGPYAGAVFDWCALELGRRGLPAGWAQWIVMRRETSPSPGTHHLKTACYRCVGPAQTSAAALTSLAAARWRSEICFETARTGSGLAQYQVRDWRGWYAHVTLSMAAAALALPPSPGPDRT